ncbi:50S ribosomal protein L23 [Candidatus Daviesbacteria bacterium]|nr:50S ribosomal protein L23 [Candidatus Daviesbacteria bacterium]
MRTVLLRPLINEKSMALTKIGFYTFEVDSNATKTEVEKLIQDKFKVDVESVKTLNLPRKRKLQRTRRGYFLTSPTRKAIVKLKKGQKIPLFEGASETEEVKVTTAEGEPVTTVKEKKSLLRGTKVKIEKEADRAEETKETKSKRGKLVTST